MAGWAEGAPAAVAWPVARMLGGGLAVLLLAACSIPIPKAEADPTRTYVLSTTDAPAAGGRPVQVGRVEVANYLRNRALVVRRGPNEIEFREYARWGESLDAGVARVLGDALALGAAAPAADANAARRPLLEANVRVLACEGNADGGIHFQATWELVDTGGELRTVARGEFRAPAELRWDGRNEASLAAALSRAVAALAAEIGAAAGGTGSR